MTEMLVIVPTRNRPANAARLIESFISTGANANLLLCIDDDDPSEGDYARLIQQHSKVSAWLGPRKRIGPTLNDAATYYADEYRIIGFMGDDHLPRTAGWDRRIAEALPSTGIAYGNDLLQGPNLPTAAFLTSNIVQALGYLCPPGLLHMYLDDAWKAWGDGAGCLQYLGDVIIEHMHPGLGKAEQDASYTESNALMGPDQQVYNAYQQSQLAADIERIRTLQHG